MVASRWRRQLRGGAGNHGVRGRAGTGSTAGRRLADGLAGLEGVAEVRGLGLLLAAELDGLASKPVAQAAVERGLIVNAVTPTALRMAPSLLVSEAEIDEAVAILGVAMAAVAAGRGS